VQRELGEYPGLAGSWVTQGYTIENYVPPELLREAVTRVHRDTEPTWTGDPYVNPLGTERLGERTSPPDKAAIARAVAERWAEVEDWPLDLRERVGELAQVIRRANGTAATI
jgi:hypothetical protein